MRKVRKSTANVTREFATPCCLLFVGRGYFCQQISITSGIAVPAPKGNQFWKARSKHGRNPIFKTPQQLLKGCTEYFEWVDANPLQEEKVFCFQGEVTRVKVDKMRAMTIGGLCVFLDISPITWRDYCTKENFSAVTTRVNEIIREQKFTGAAADLLNANIIARDLGLADKREHSGPGGGPLRAITTDMSAQEAAEAYADTLRGEG